MWIFLQKSGGEITSCIIMWHRSHNQGGWRCYSTPTFYRRKRIGPPHGPDWWEMCLAAVQQTPNRKSSRSLAFQWQSGPSCAQVLCYSPRPTGLIPRLLLNPGNETQTYCSDKTTYCMYHLCSDGIYVYDMMAKHKRLSLLRTYKQLWKRRNYSFQLVLGAKRLWFLKLWRTLTRIIYEWNTWKLNLRHFQIR